MSVPVIVRDWMLRAVMIPFESAFVLAINIHLPDDGES